MVGVLRRRFHRLDPFGENLLDRRPIDRTRLERQNDRRRFRLQLFEKPIFVDLREPSRRRAKLLPQTVAISPVFLSSSVAAAPFERPSVSRRTLSALEPVVFADFVLISVALAPSFARRGIARPPFKTSTSKTISPVGVRVERGASFAAVRFRVAPFGVSSVVSFRAFLGQSHPFVFRSRLQCQGVRFGVKTRRSVKIGARRSDADAGTLRPNANAPKKDALAVSARRIKRNIRRRF